jgi:competence protein CoiA
MQGAAHGMFWRLSENPERTKADMVRIHGIDEIEEQIIQTYCGHHQYDWIRPHRTWLDAACAVYIDFGDEFLVRLETYDNSGLPCIRFISKQKFVHDAMIEESAQAIASRFYPSPDMRAKIASI